MSLWDLGLFAGASFLALRSIIALMTQHKEQYKQEIAKKHLQHIVEQEAASIKESEAARKAAETEEKENSHNEHPATAA